MSNSLITDTLIDCQRHPQRKKKGEKEKETPQNLEKMQIEFDAQNVQKPSITRDVLLAFDDHFTNPKVADSFVAIPRFSHFHGPFSVRHSGERYGCPLTAETGVSPCTSAHDNSNPTDRMPPSPKEGCPPYCSTASPDRGTEHILVPATSAQGWTGVGKDKRGSGVPLSVTLAHSRTMAQIATGGIGCPPPSWSGYPRTFTAFC